MIALVVVAVIFGALGLAKILAAAGLLALLAGALTVHMRTRDRVPELLPAVGCVVLVTWYLTVLFGAAG